MHSFTAPCSCLHASLCSFTELNPQVFPSITSIWRKQQRFLALNLVGETEKRGSLFGFNGNTRGYEKGLFCGWYGLVRRCKNWDDEGDVELEMEIFEFMKNSKKPEAFPSKKELVDAGRMDLVEAIVKRGGWLSLGWDLDEEEGTQENGIGDSGSLADCFQKSNNMQDSGVVSFFSDGSSHPASSSGRSLETETTKDEIGVEGILSRLQKQRNQTFGLGLGDKEDSTFLQSNDVKEDWHPKLSKDLTVTGLTKSSRLSSLSPEKTLYDDSKGRVSQKKSLPEIDGLTGSVKPEMWRAWSIQRAGSSDMDFEAAEFSSDEVGMGGSKDISKDKIIEIRESTSVPNNRKELNFQMEEISHNQIQSRLQDLELELSSVLHPLRPKANDIAIKEGHENSSDDLWKLSDAWEFQENEIMNAQDKLRSIRAKLSVLEGKIALAIIDAQKVVEQKQSRIDDAQRALCLLRPTCIIWPNTATEVLLAGSFDGWASKRKMEKSKTGIFSLCLQLYPGEYEIDPLRPTVRNNGYENNVLVIH
nr:protein PTST homolog 2, chloroplastic isoform X2 [Ziziphus jujuba var. spinosa]